MLEYPDFMNKQASTNLEREREASRGQRGAVAEVFRCDLQPFLTEFGDQETQELCEWWGAELRAVLAEISPLFSIRLIQHQDGGGEKALRNIVSFASSANQELATQLILNEIPLTNNPSSMAKAALRERPTVMLFKPEKKANSRDETLDQNMQIAVRDVTAKTFATMRAVESAGFGSAICVPCEKIGLITAYLKTSVDYHEPQIVEIIRRVQEINARFADKLENTNNQKVLSHCLEVANRTGGLKNILPEFLRAITEYGPITDASIAFWEEKNGEDCTQMVARFPSLGDVRDKDPGDLVSNRGLIQRIKTGAEKYILIDTTDESSENQTTIAYLGEMIAQNGIKKILALPLSGENNQRIGALVIDGYHEKSFGPKEIRHFQNAAGTLSLLITKERAKEREEQKAHLVRMLMHEMKGSLAKSGAAAQRIVKLTKREPPDLEKIKQFSAIVATESLKAEEIMNFLRLLTNKEKISLKNIAVAEIHADIITRAQTLKRDDEEKGVLKYKISLVGDDKLAMPVAINDSALNQIVENLLRNAIRYGERDDEGAVRVTIEMHADGEELKLIFSNPGAIAPELMKSNKLFKSYVTTGKERGGTGLGLAICEECVRAMGGKISVKSENGGVTFTVALPFVTESRN
ncbi:MAG: hypothetical protein ACD_65C00021G0002 [uncultured bacterium]|nr:MAG: hypothetical protein ACD_65C00021G0002 [uncultured bacterium]